MPLGKQWTSRIRTTSRYYSREMEHHPVRWAALPRTSRLAPLPRTGTLRYRASSHPRLNRGSTREGYHRSVGYLEPAWRGQDVEPDIGSRFFERTYRRRRGKGRTLRDRGGLPRLARPKGCVATWRGRSAAGPAWLVKAPRAGPDGRTNPLRHRLLYTDSPSRAASRARTAGPWDRSCPRSGRSRGGPTSRSGDVDMLLWSRGGSAHVRRSRRYG